MDDQAIKPKPVSVSVDAEQGRGNVTEIRRAGSGRPALDAEPDASDTASKRSGTRESDVKEAEAPCQQPVARESSAPTATAVQPPPPARKRGLLRPLLFALLPVLLVGGGYWYVVGGQVMSTENAYVQADMVGISTDVAGIVSEIDVKDNQTVKAGDVLFRLDDQQFRFAVDRADAQVGLVRNDLAAMQANYKALQSQIDQANTDIDYYQTAFKRQQDLASKSIASQATFDQARHDVETAQQKLALLKNQLVGLAANLNGDPNAPIENHPRFKDAIAARNEAMRQLDHTIVHAPMDGIVTNVPTLQKGQYLAAATTAFSLVSTDHVWVQANPKETELTWVKPGQKAVISVDAYPGHEWQGVVDSISPASAAAFSVLPAENTSGNWVKVVQRISLKVRIATGEDEPRLRSGMSVVLDIDTGHARGVPAMLSGWFGKSAAAGERHG